MKKKKKTLNKKQKVKQKFKQELSIGRQYKTTFKDIKRYFRILNEVVFGNRLSPFNEVLIKNIKKAVGQVVIHEQERKGTKQYVLEMLPKYQDKRYFVSTLGHEMVPLYQMQNLGDTGNHNQLFYSFQPKLNQIGLTI